jgi:hypothetical protein
MPPFQIVVALQVPSKTAVVNTNPVAGTVALSNGDRG